MQQQGAQPALIVVGDNQVEPGDQSSGNNPRRICQVERNALVRTSDGLVAQCVIAGEGGLTIQVQQQDAQTSVHQKTAEICGHRGFAHATLGGNHRYHTHDVSPAAPSAR